MPQSGPVSKADEIAERRRQRRVAAQLGTFAHRDDGLSRVPR